MEYIWLFMTFKSSSISLLRHKRSQFLCFLHILLLRTMSSTCKWFLCGWKNLCHIVQYLEYDLITYLYCCLSHVDKILFSFSHRNKSNSMNRMCRITSSIKMPPKPWWIGWHWWRIDLACTLIPQGTPTPCTASWIESRYYKCLYIWFS